MRAGPAGGIGDRAVFSYRASLAPSFWMLLAIMAVELLVVHPLIALWSVPVALALSVLSLLGIGWVVRSVASFGSLPVELGHDALVMRVGALKSCRVPLTLVARATGDVAAAEVRTRETMNLALLAWPNVLVELARPVRYGRRSVVRLAHRLDDAPAFLRELDRRLEARP